MGLQKEEFLGRRLRKASQVYFSPEGNNELLQHLRVHILVNYSPVPTQTITSTPRLAHLSQVHMVIFENFMYLTPKTKRNIAISSWKMILSKIFVKFRILKLYY